MQPLLETVVRRRELPSLTHYVEISTTGMRVTCRVIEDRGSFTITREMFWIEKSKHRWTDYVQKFYEIACEHYPLRDHEGFKVNVNKSGSL